MPDAKKPAQRSPRLTGGKSLVRAADSIDDIHGVTLDERAKLVLLTLGRTEKDIQQAFRKLAARYHPDKAGGDTEKFQLINEAYMLLTRGIISKRPMLADDTLMLRVVGKHMKRLINRQAEWEEYEKWHRAKFYWDW
jgi:hypothetical protein